MDPQPEQTPQPTQSEPASAPTSQPTPPTTQQQPTPPMQPGSASQQVVMIENPGQTLAIVGIVLDVIGIGVGGIILGVMARNRSRAAGMSTSLGTVSMVYGIILSAIAALWLGFMIVILIMTAGSPQTSTPTSAPVNSSTAPAPTLSQ